MLLGSNVKDLLHAMEVWEGRKFCSGFFWEHRLSGRRINELD
jgi:hypothetical protein